MKTGIHYCGVTLINSLKQGFRNFFFTRPFEQIKMLPPPLSNILMLTTPKTFAFYY